MRFLALLFLFSLGMATLSDHVSAASIKASDHFIPHRVLYEMKLKRALSGSDIKDAKGQMLYRFQRECEGWSVETRVFLQLIYGRHEETEVVETTWSFDSFETLDGRALSFQVDHKRDGERLEVISGDARRDQNQDVKVFFHGDTALEKTISAGSLFPTAHLERLMNDARVGRKTSSDIVFDGASMSNPYQVNTVIVGRVVDDSVIRDKPNIVAGARQVPVIRGASTPFQRVSSAHLGDSPVWRVRMAYFPVATGRDVPEFEIEVDFREDAIAQRIIQDFGDFVLELEPIEYEHLSAEKCD